MALVVDPALPEWAHAARPGSWCSVCRHADGRRCTTRHFKAVHGASPRG